MSKNKYVAFATHDIYLIDTLRDIVKDYPKNKYEFQVLIGVPTQAKLNHLLRENHKVRQYIPYGDKWYEYSLRRMRENPELWKPIVKSLLI